MEGIPKLTEDEQTELAELEAQAAELEALGGEKGYGYPKPPSKESQFKFFKEIIDREDSSKVANLDTSELGNLKLSVRSLLDLANYMKAENLGVVEKYFKDKAEIILSTSDSKKGFLAQLFVTQIKKDQKMKTPEVKRSFFGKKKEEE